jgi:HPt (histidine-containing phosphotransfer) domain-containing protein
MPEARPSIDALLALARAEFAQRLPAKTAEIERLVSGSAWEEARRAAHKLRGSAATYGFPALSAAAAAIEDALLAAGGPPDAAVRVRVADVLRGACVEAERACREGQ